MRRRTFVKIAALTATALAATTREVLSQSSKVARQDGMVDPSDRVAVLLGYVEDATKADSAKFSQYKPGQNCGNCQLYLGSGPTAPCTVFGNKQVPAAGWCSAWAKKV